MELELESLHLATLLVTAVFIIVADHDGFNYLRGQKQLLAAPRVRFLHCAVTVGLIGMITTGALLLFEEPDVFEEPAFYVKMLMVAALVANGFAIGKLSVLSTTTPFKELAPSTQRALIIRGAISGFCWLTAAIIGLFLL